MLIHIVINNWDLRDLKKYWFEAFYYGPVNCKIYKAEQFVGGMGCKRH